VTSVCTGALLLAKCGVLGTHRATTHWAALDLLASLHGEANVERLARVVDDGVVTSAGVAAGIDMAFHMVEKLCGRAIAEETAHYIEYPLGFSSAPRPTSSGKLQSTAQANRLVMSFAACIASRV